MPENRQVQDCRDERRQVCQPVKRCYWQPVQRPCPPPQYWTSQGCAYRPTVTPQPNTPTILREVAPDKSESNTPPNTAELDTSPPPPPYIPEKADPPQPNVPPPPPPSIPEKVPDPPQSNVPPVPSSPAKNDTGSERSEAKGPVIDVIIAGRSWRIEIDPVPILWGTGIALLLGLLALRPGRTELSAEDLHRLGITCRSEPDLGGQTVTHLETPPVGPRITVRAAPGTRRYGVEMQ